MKKILIFFAVVFGSLSLLSCQTLTEKIDKKTSEEERELSKWLNQPESELKIFFGKPDKIEFTNSRNRYYIYVTEKLKVKCQRKFEINPNNVVIGFSSKNCF
jgi:GTP-binding protein EngB required for normal cell division